MYYHIALSKNFKILDVGFYHLDAPRRRPGAPGDKWAAGAFWPPHPFWFPSVILLT